LASGGYIITMRPMAMGMLVVPTDHFWMNSGRPLNAQPRPTPTNMARKIQSVR
jgi:hypothetical protein